MGNVTKHQILTEEEYRKKVFTPLYDSKESRDEIISNGKKQVEELQDAEKIILEQMLKFIEKYKDM